MNIVRAGELCIFIVAMSSHTGLGGHLPPTPPHLECLNTILSNISQELKMSSEHSFRLNVFIIKSIYLFTGWSALEDSVVEDCSCSKACTRAVVSQHRALSGKTRINPHNVPSMPLT